MGLETLTGTVYLDSLVSTNPTSSDNKSEGDDHIRGIKNTLLNSFPGISGAVTATHTEINYLDITTLGAGAASKAVVLDTGDDYTWPATGILTYGVLKDSVGTTLTSTAAEMNLLDGSSVSGYNLGIAKFTGQSLIVTTQEANPYGLVISQDGTALYVCGASGSVYQYTLSTAWDLSTASYASKSFSFASEDSGSVEIRFKSDGTSMYMLGGGADSVYQYTLSTAWDVSTASYASKSFSVATQETTPFGLEFSSDGTAMYVCGLINATVYQYTLSTAWDVSTASYASKSTGVSSQTTAPSAIAFSSDGVQMIITGGGAADVYQYDLLTAWDVSTASYSNTSFGSLPGSSVAYGLTYSNTGSKMYILANSTDTIFQYVTGFIAPA